ncbi:MAG: acetyl-CoA carboxylase, carboxyltransferase subunit beta [Acidobacteriota bacterium]|nr:acetyl-CoA carboxylase, carboxyltransferase subunit beta [Acidobacteriota bacterium]MDH3784200.1 acetyl-CoA carboxylase, carboxyltransferase subunit beta [Acidobacteriota bacterium]
MAWFKKEKTPKQPQVERRLRMPEGLWVKCSACKEMVYKKEVVLNANVCPKCNYHFRISARERLAMLLDDGESVEFDQDIGPRDALNFADTKKYSDRIKTYQQRTGLKDALVSSAGKIGGHPVVVAVMEYGFMGGSMGSVVGEKVTRCAERALRDRCPLIVFSCSGGARMQEGALSLMQMAKISSALARLDEAGLPYIAVLTDPTTGGVTASFAMLGDLNLAEPRALIGFAGPRVIEQTIRQKLPEGFQRSEFLFEHGMIDQVVERSRLREVLTRAFDFMMPGDGAGITPQ